jgi:hypothetical protein
MDTGYDLQRVRALGQRTIAAIAALDAIGSTDPGAADALRAIRLTRLNLEDLWMPAIRDIERSNAMIDWIARRPMAMRSPTGDATPDLARLAGAVAPVRPLASASDGELLELVGLIDRLLGDASQADGPFDLGTLPRKYDADVLAAELALRVERDPSFGRDLLALAPHTVLIGQLIGRASFPVPFALAMATALAGPVSARASAALRQHALAMSAVLRALAADPGASLDLLTDDAVLLRLATWDDLDATALGDFTLAAMLDGVVADPTRLADGFGVLARLTDVAGGPLDDGPAAGMARGLALAMPVYLPQLAAGVFQTGDGPVRVSKLGLTIGTHDEVADLFGALMRDDEAAGALGLALGAYTDARLRHGGVDLTAAGSIDDVVHLSVLLDHAARSEQAQIVMEAAAEEARRRRLGDLLGIGATIALTATGAGAVWRSTASTAIRAVTAALAGVAPERLAAASITAHQYQQIWMSAMAVALDREGPDLASSARGRSIRRDVRRRLDDIEACDDPTRRGELIVDLRTAVDGTELAEFVDGVMQHSGLSTLR